MNIQTINHSETQVIISTEDLQKLVELAEKVEPIKIKMGESDFDTTDLMRLAENGGAFAFLHDDGEDIYTLDDLKVSYK